jgi:hypothetical protein
VKNSGNAVEKDFKAGCPVNHIPEQGFIMQQQTLFVT